MLLDAEFSPDGTRIVTASRDKTVRLWDAIGQPIGEPLKGHTDIVSSAEFSPDGKRIVTASWDRTVRLWDAAAGQQIGAPLGNDAPVAQAASVPTARALSPLPLTGPPGCGTSNRHSKFGAARQGGRSTLSHICAARGLFSRPKPPAWCIEMEKWPYNTPEWKQWLANVRAGKKPPLLAAQ